MHRSAYLKAELFLKHYAEKLPRRDGKSRVLEVGSKSYGGQDTYRGLFDDAAFSYVGLDVEHGKNVDIVPRHGYVWSEIADASFDLSISGQTFEHNPFYWVTFCEIARILVPGGYAFITAPGGGQVHRFPYDCWRFYPDAWLALTALTGMELVESYYETDETAELIQGGNFRDSAVIARKPQLAGAALEAFHQRLRDLSAPYAGRSFAIPTPTDSLGPCFADYERTIKARPAISPMRRLHRRLNGKASGRLYSRVGMAGAKPPAGHGGA